ASSRVGGLHGRSQRDVAGGVLALFQVHGHPVERRIHLECGEHHTVFEPLERGLVPCHLSLTTFLSCGVAKHESPLEKTTTRETARIRGFLRMLQVVRWQGVAPTYARKCRSGNKLRQLRFSLVSSRFSGRCEKTEVAGSRSFTRDNDAAFHDFARR